MKSMSILRSLTLAIPLIWLSILLMAAVQHVSAGGRLIASQVKDQSSAQQKQQPITGMTEAEKKVFDTFVDHESRFKDHYQAHFSKSNYEYNQYRPAYQHGFALGLGRRYHKTDWNSIEPQVRSTWDEGTMGLWNQYKDAVRYGWEQGIELAGK